MLCLLALTNGNCLYSYNACVCGCLKIIASSATYLTTWLVKEPQKHLAMYACALKLYE